MRCFIFQILNIAKYRVKNNKFPLPNNILPVNNTDPKIKKITMRYGDTFGDSVFRYFVTWYNKFVIEIKIKILIEIVSSIGKRRNGICIR
ncbi:hypothetical protein CH366_14550 [Leptospira harrisiae]|nr:hypothetical protein CH366_14550 [Leptospira harrisiae]